MAKGELQTVSFPGRPVAVPLVFGYPLIYHGRHDISLELETLQSRYTVFDFSTPTAFRQGGMKSLPSWEHFPHDADMGVRGIGMTKAEAFEQAALALTAVIVELETVEERTQSNFSCEASDDELLLVDWLNTLVFNMDQEKMLYHRFHIVMENHRLGAMAWGEPIDRQRHQPVVEVKGATYTELSVHQRPDGHWVAQCVVDV